MGIKELIPSIILLGLIGGTLFLSYNLYQPPEEFSNSQHIEKGLLSNINFSPNGKYIVVLGDKLTILNNEGEIELFNYNTPISAKHIAWTNDGNRMAISRNSYLEIYDIQPSIFIRSYFLDNSISNVKLNSTHFWYISSDFIQIWHYNITHFEVVSTIYHGIPDITDIDFSPSGYYFLSKFDNGKKLGVFDISGHFIKDLSNKIGSYNMEWANNQTLIEMPIKSNLNILKLNIETNQTTKINIKRVFNSESIFLPSGTTGDLIFLDINRFITSENFLTIHVLRGEQQSTYSVRYPYEQIDLKTITYNSDTNEIAFLADYGKGYDLFKYPLDGINLQRDRLLQFCSLILAISILGLLIQIYYSRRPELGGESNLIRIFLNYDGYRLNDSMIAVIMRILIGQNIFLLFYYLNGILNVEKGHFGPNLFGWIHYIVAAVLAWSDICAFVLLFLMIAVSRRNQAIKNYGLISLGVWFISTIYWRTSSGLIFNLHSDFRYFQTPLTKTAMILSILSFSSIVFSIDQFIRSHKNAVQGSIYNITTLSNYALIICNTIIGVFSIIASFKTSILTGLGFHIFLSKISLIPILFLVYIYLKRRDWS